MTDDILSFSSDRQGLLSSHVREEDLEPEIVSLRPKLLTDYVGQRDVVETLKIAIEAAAQRSEPIDHVLLHGPRGSARPRWLHHRQRNGVPPDHLLRAGP